MEKEIEGKRLFSVWRPPAADMKQTYLSFCATVFFFFFHQWCFNFLRLGSLSYSFNPQRNYDLYILISSSDLFTANSHLSTKKLKKKPKWSSAKASRLKFKLIYQKKDYYQKNTFDNISITRLSFLCTYCFSVGTNYPPILLKII